VNPQPKGIVPPEHAETIRMANQQLAAARVARDAAIAAALLAGGSVREVAAVAEMSTNTIFRIGKAGGWPTKEYLKARAETRAANKAWREMIERGLERLRRNGTE
jgi:hypothetical protein